MSFPLKVLALIGALYGISITIKLLRFLHYWLRPTSISRYLYSHPKTSSPPWALITGSSDGIGLSLANELASKNFNIILHGRNPTKLSAAKAHLLSSYPSIQVRTIIIDACSPNEELVSNINLAIEQIKDLHITVLINNIGGPAPNMSPLYKPLSSTTPQEITQQLSINITFTTLLTSLLIPYLPNPALILNTGSTASQGLPYVAIYSGSKGFMESWSRSLSREMRMEKREIEVLCVKPMKVTGNSFRNEKGTWNMPDSRTFARVVLSRVGGGVVVGEGYWVHAVIASLVGCLPEWLLYRFMAKAVRKEAEKDKKRD